MANYLRRVMAADTNAGNNDSGSEDTDEDLDEEERKLEAEENRQWRTLQSIPADAEEESGAPLHTGRKASLRTQKLAENLVAMPDHGRHQRLFPLASSDSRDTAARLLRRRERQDQSEGRGAGAHALHLPPILSKAEYEAKTQEDGKAGGNPRGGAQGGERRGAEEDRQNVSYAQDEEDFGLGEDVRLVPRERCEGFRRGLRSRVRTRRDRQQMLSEEIDLRNLKNTLEGYRKPGRAGGTLGPIQKLYGAAGELSASELDSLCAPKSTLGLKQLQSKKPQDGVTRLLRKMEVGGAVLNLAHSLCGYDDLDSLSRFLGGQPHITTLVLCNNAVNDRGLALLSAALLKATRIEVLDVSDNVFGLDGVRALSSVLRKSKNGKCHGLKHLNLSGNTLEDSPIEVLAAALSENIELRTLNLSNCKVGDEGAAKLGGMMESNVTLKSLDLSWNKFGPRAAEAMKQALSHTQLEQLDLSWNGLGDAGGVQIAEALSTPTCSLKEILLRGNQIGPLTCQSLVAALSQRSIIEVVDLSYNPLMKTGTSQLLKALANSMNLHLLRLDRCTFCDVGAFVEPAEFDLNKPNGKYSLDLTDTGERDVLSQLFKAAAEAESLDSFHNSTLNGNPLVVSEDLNWGTDPPAKGLVAFEFKSQERPSEEAAPITDEQFRKIWTNLMYPDASDAWKFSLISVITVDHHFTCAQAGEALSSFNYTQEKVMAARSLFSRVVDLESIEDMLGSMNYSERTAFFTQQGVFGKYHPKLPTGHHTLQLNRQLDYMIACKLLFQYRKEHREGDLLLEEDINIPWQTKIKNVASCWKNVSFNGVKQFVSHPDEIMFERSGTLDLDFVSFERPWEKLPSPVSDDMFHLLVTSLQSEYIENPDALVQRVRGVSEQRAHAVVVKMLRVMQTTGGGKKNIRRGSIIRDRPNTQGGDFKDPRCPECLVHDIAWGLQVVRAFVVGHWVSVNQMKDLLYIFGRETQARVEVFVACFGRIVDFFRMPELMRALVNEEQNLVNRRLGYLSTVNFAYPSMHYRLVLKEPEDYVVGQRLVKIARMTKAQAFYNLKIDDRPISLREDSKMWKLLQGSPQDRAEPKTVIEFDFYLEDEQRSIAAATFIQSKWRAYSRRSSYLKQRKASAKVKLAFVSQFQKGAVEAFQRREKSEKSEELAGKFKKAGKAAQSASDLAAEAVSLSQERAEAEAAYERATSGAFTSSIETTSARPGVSAE